MPLAVVDVDVAASVRVQGDTRITSAGPARLGATTTTTIDARPGLPDLGALPADAGAAIVIADTTASVGSARQRRARQHGGQDRARREQPARRWTAVDASAYCRQLRGGRQRGGQRGAQHHPRAHRRQRPAPGRSRPVSACTASRIPASPPRPGRGSASPQPLSTGTETRPGTLADYEDEASTSDGSQRCRGGGGERPREHHPGRARRHPGGHQRMSRSAAGGTDPGGRGRRRQQHQRCGRRRRNGRAQPRAHERGGAHRRQRRRTGHQVVATRPRATRSMRFTTAATSGAGASDVGVAGALALQRHRGQPHARITGSADAKAAPSVSAATTAADPRPARPPPRTPPPAATPSASAPPWRSTSSPTSRAELAHSARLINRSAVTVGPSATTPRPHRAEAGAGAASPPPGGRGRGGH